MTRYRWGAAATAVAGTAACEDGFFTRGECLTLVYVLGVPLAAASGLVAGAIIGALIRTDRWEDLPLARRSTGAVPGRLIVAPTYAQGAAGLSARIAF